MHVIIVSADRIHIQIIPTPENCVYLIFYDHTVIVSFRRYKLLWTWQWNPIIIIVREAMISYWRIQEVLSWWNIALLPMPIM